MKPVIGWPNFAEPGLLLAVLEFVVLTGVLTGLYPSLNLSRFHPIKVLTMLWKLVTHK
jgi:ABC-type antimicrobial peptide transport system permease subunit